MTWAHPADGHGPTLEMEMGPSLGWAHAADGDGMPCSWRWAYPRHGPSLEMDMGPPSIWRWADPRNEDELALEMDRFRVSALEVTLFQMETTTFRFSRVYTSAVDSVSQLPRYCL